MKAFVVIVPFLLAGCVEAVAVLAPGIFETYHWAIAPAAR